MFPGLGGRNPKQMERVLRQHGVSVEEIGDVEEVVIKTQSKQYIFQKPSVIVMSVQGQKTYQIVGDARVMEKEKFSEEDVALVAQQTNVSVEEAREALKKCDGQPADAIMLIQSHKK